MGEIEKYIDNILFIRWVYEPDDDLSAYWELYCLNHPEEAGLLVSLKNELQSFKIINQKLSVDSKNQLSARIIREIKKRQKVNRTRSIGKKFLRYAAIAMLFIIIGGALVYLRPEKENMLAKIQYFDIPGMAGNPMLLLSDGSKINLGSNTPEIRFISTGRAMIDNDRVIDLPVGNDVHNQLMIPYGCRGKIVLSDKSVIWLNAGSRLFFPSGFTGHQREVFLFGEAFFDVSKNEKQPFRVKTAKYNVSVLGTEFNVSAYLGDNQSQTILTEGNIELEFENKGWFDKKIKLQPNELFTYDNESGETSVSKVQPDDHVLWKDGFVRFKDADFRSVIRKVERFYNIQIKLENPSDENIRFNGKLNLKNDKYEVMYYITKVANRKFIEKNESLFVIQ